MTSTIITKNSSTASSVPLAADLTQGELAVNVTDKKLYSKDSGGSVVKLVGSLGNQEANATAITGGTINGTAIGGTTAAAVSATTLSASGAVTLSGGTANGVTYLNGSKVLTSGSALTFDGTNFIHSGASFFAATTGNVGIGTNSSDSKLRVIDGAGNGIRIGFLSGSSNLNLYDATSHIFRNAGGTGEYATLNSTGLGIGTSSPLSKLTVAANNASAGNEQFYITGTANTQQLRIGYNTTSNYGSIQAIQIGTAYRDLVLNADGGNVGIGTSSPDTKLDVASGNAEAIRLSSNSYLSTGQGPWIGFDGGPSASWNMARIQATRAGTEFQGNLLFFTNNSTTDGTAATERMRLDSAGNLGLGVTPSAWSGFISVLQQRGGGHVLGDTGAFMQIGANNYYNGTNWIYTTTAPASRFTQNNGLFQWYTAASGTTGTAISFTQAMTLDASGNLAIGDTSTSYKLDIAKLSATSTEAAVRNTNGRMVLTQQAGGGAVTQYYKDAAATYVAGVGSTVPGGSAASALIFSDYQGSWTERARIDSAGNFMRGQTSTGLQNSNGVALDTAGYIVQNHSGTASGTRYAYFGYNGGEIGSITQNGTTAVAYNTSSDYRLKNTIAPMTGALAKVAQLKPVTYKWNADGSDGEGFIAHELAEVCPHAVTGEKDAVDEEGNPKYQGIDTSFLVATLTAAIQELKASMDAVKAEFDAYKASHP